MGKTSVLLVDRSGLFRRGVHLALAAVQDIEVIGEAQSAEEAFTFIGNNAPNIVLLDADVPDSFGVARRANWCFPPILVVFVAEDEDPESIFMALRCGAVACVTRSIDSGELVGVIRRVSRGQSPISESLLKPEVGSLVLREFTSFAQEQESAVPLAPLSAQQAEILEHVLRDKSSEQIGEEMGADEQAIKRQLTDIAQKLAANAHTYDLALALRCHLAPDGDEISSYAERRDLALSHLVNALRAAVAEAEGDEDLAGRLRAEARLRLVAMAEEEIWELARLTSVSRDTPVELVYDSIRRAIQRHQATASEWLKDLAHFREKRGR